MGKFSLSCELYTKLAAQPGLESRAQAVWLSLPTVTGKPRSQPLPANPIKAMLTVRGGGAMSPGL